MTSHRVPSTEHRVGSFLAALFFQNGGRLQYVIGISFPFLDGVVNLLFFCYWGYTEGKTSIKNVRKNEKGQQLLRYESSTLILYKELSS